MNTEDTIEDIEAALAVAFGKAPEAIAMVEPRAAPGRSECVSRPRTDAEHGERAELPRSM
jgi:hypothetical protein